VSIDIAAGGGVLPLNKAGAIALSVASPYDGSRWIGVILAVEAKAEVEMRAVDRYSPAQSARVFDHPIYSVF